MTDPTIFHEVAEFREIGHAPTIEWSVERRFVARCECGWYSDGGDPAKGSETDEAARELHRKHVRRVRRRRGYKTKEGDESE